MRGRRERAVLDDGRKALPPGASSAKIHAPQAGQRPHLPLRRQRRRIASWDSWAIWVGFTAGTGTCTWPPDGRRHVSPSAAAQRFTCRDRKRPLNTRPSCPGSWSGFLEDLGPGATHALIHTDRSGTPRGAAVRALVAETTGVTAAVAAQRANSVDTAARGDAPGKARRRTAARRRHQHWRAPG